MDTRLDVAADFLMNLGRLAQTRLDLRNIHMTESLLRLRRSLPVITFNIIVKSSRRKSVRIDVIHLEINNPMIKTRIVKSFVCFPSGMLLFKTGPHRRGHSTPSDCPRKQTVFKNRVHHNTLSRLRCLFLFYGNRLLPQSERIQNHHTIFSTVARLFPDCFFVVFFINRINLFPSPVFCAFTCCQ